MPNSFLESCCHSISVLFSPARLTAKHWHLTGTCLEWLDNFSLDADSDDAIVWAGNSLKSAMIPGTQNGCNV